MFRELLIGSRRQKLLVCANRGKIVRRPPAKSFVVVLRSQLFVKKNYSSSWQNRSTILRSIIVQQFRPSLSYAIRPATISPIIHHRAERTRTSFKPIARCETERRAPVGPGGPRAAGRAGVVRTQGRSAFLPVRSQVQGRSNYG